MADVLVNNISVPRIARNKRIYAGNTGISKTIKSGGNITSVHIETARLTNLTSNLVPVFFAEKFSVTPTGWIKVYRMRQVQTGKWKQQDVLYYHAAEEFKNEYGFGLVIDPSENLTGVVIEYMFKE